jgi:hypothetical protein
MATSSGNAALLDFGDVRATTAKLAASTPSKRECSCVELFPEEE